MFSRANKFLNEINKLIINDTVKAQNAEITNYVIMRIFN